MKKREKGGLDEGERVEMKESKNDDGEDYFDKEELFMGKGLWKLWTAEAGMVANSGKNSKKMTRGGAFLDNLFVKREKLLQWGFILVFLFAVMLFYCVPVMALGSFDFPNFSDAAKNELLELGWTAKFSSGLLRLTPTLGQSEGGTAFTKEKISLKNNRPFSTYFVISSNGYDGLAFVLQSVSTTARGWYYGYSGMPSSVAVIFKTDWSQEVRIGLNGNCNIRSVSHASSGHVWIDYDGTYLDVRMNSNSTRPANPIIHYPIDIVSYTGDEVYVGFTGISGAVTGHHDISKWSFTINEPPTIDFTSLPAGSKIHKLENTLSFNIRASDSDSEDQNLTTTIYLNGTQVKNFTAKNITTGV